MKTPKIIPSQRTASLRGRPFGPWVGDRPVRLLPKEEQQRLTAISTYVDFHRGAQIFRQGDRADVVYALASGVVKTSRFNREGKETITAFHFAEDLLGIAERGWFVNSAEAIRPVAAWQIPVARLEELLRTDAALELHVLCKLCHELREEQRHAILLASESAQVRLLLFLSLMLEEMPEDLVTSEAIRLPMGREAIANFIGVSPETVSRIFRRLTDDGLLDLPHPREVVFRDREAFDAEVAKWSGELGRPPQQ